MKSSVILGIDPGLTGAAAYLGGDWCAVKDLPTKPGPDGARRIDVRAFAEQIQLTVPAGASVQVFLEQLLPGGVQKEGRSNTYSAGVQHRTVGLLQATVELLGLEFDEVAPQKWKALYGLTGKQADKAAVTRRAIELAQLLYPDLVPDLKRVKDHNRAEAVLIAHWARKVRA